MELCEEFLKKPDIPDIFDVVLFNGGKFTDYNDFLTIKNRCRFIILVDIKTNPSTSKIIENIQNDNKLNPNTWKKFYELSENHDNENPSFVIYFKK